ncbi:hypothetical protein FOZ60_005477 [Perkinsus olseni]|uniref:RNase H type-1 domain-containing protein n=1 Tax=Perkinsus olseni TaxID=32597 RepID=A0A7J6NR55_PEROL|nr:hypothetical protein FOZ60_005477 [Perkinsus olseni]
MVMSREKDTSMAVQKATEVMKQLTDEGKAVIALSLDMRGAFSNARHDVICTTVEEMCSWMLWLSSSPALGLNISEEKSVLLGDKAFIERYDCVRGIKRKDGCSALSPKGREVIRNHITGVLAYGLVCWGDRLRFKTTRDRISAVDLRLEKRSSPSPKWWGTVVKQPYPVKGTVDHTVTNATPLPRGWVHIGNGREVTGTITEGLAGGKVIFPEVEVVIYTDGSRTPAVDDNDDDTTRVGAGYYSDSELIGNGRVKLPHFANIAQAESLAVLEAMRKAAESGGFSTILIASDSQAILKSLLSRRKSQLSSDIVDLALSTDIDFRFIWVRGHAGSTGNSIADGMARSGSIVGTFRTVPVPGSHLRELVSQSVRTRLPLSTHWQEIKNKTIRSFITSNHHLAIFGAFYPVSYASACLTSHIWPTQDRSLQVKE